MKKLLAMILVLMMALPCVLAETVDTYTGASLTKSFVAEADMAALAAPLTMMGADIATTKEASAPDYVKMYNAHVNVLTVNPDGCPGLSTIGYWRYVDNHEGGVDVKITAGDWSYTRRGEGVDQVVFQLTDGQNARNLAGQGVGGRCTIQVKVDRTTYLIHLNTVEIFEQKFTQEAYEAGEFATGYSGADRQATSYYFVCDVLSIEQTTSIL